MGICEYCGRLVGEKTEDYLCPVFGKPLKNKPCEIKGCSDVCKNCNGIPYTLNDNKEIKHECVLHLVWRERLKPTKSLPYVPLSSINPKQAENKQ